MKRCEGVEVEFHVFLTLALEGEWPASCPGCFTPGEIAPIPNE